MVSLLILCSVASLLRSAHAQVLPSRVTDMRSKGFSDVAYCIKKLPDGRIAAGGYGEVKIYDGETVEKVSVGKSRSVFAMCRDSLDRLFIGGRTMGVILPDPSGKMSFHSLLPLLPDSLRDFGKIHDVVCAPDGSVWFKSKEDLFRYDGRSFQNISAPGHSVLKRIRGRTILASSGKGIFELKEGMKKELLPGSRSFAENRSFTDLLPHPEKDGLWTVFTQHNGLFLYDPENGEARPLFPSGEEKDRKRVCDGSIITEACLMDSASNPYGAAFAVGTNNNGVVLVDSEGRELYHFGEEEGFRSSSIWDLTLGKSGDLWVGSSERLFLIHTGIPFTFGKKGELIEGVIWDLVRPTEPEGPLFLATMKGVWYGEGQGPHFRRVGGRKDLRCFRLLAWPPSKSDAPFRARREKKEASPFSAQKLVVTDREGFFSLSYQNKDPGRSTSLNKVLSKGTNSLASIPSAFMGQGSNGPGLLVGGTDELLVLSPDARRDIKGSEILLQVPIPEMSPGVGIEKKEKGGDSLRIWVGLYSRGVMAIDTDTGFSDYRVTRYDTSDGLPSGMVFVFPDPRGKGMFFGTYEGIHRFEDGKFKPSKAFPERFSESSVFEIRPRGDEKLWMVDGGKCPLKLLAQEGKGYRVVRDTVFRGMKEESINTVHDEGERVWFGGGKGLTCYYPHVNTDHGRSWECRIDRVKGSGDSILFEGNYGKNAPGHAIQVGDTLLERVPIWEQPEGMIPQLPYSENRLKFRFAAYAPDDQEAVHYRYKLRGNDTVWSDLTHETKKEYTNLWEGTYTFKVKAVNVYDKESSTATYRFRILPPWYRTWTAYTGYSLAGAGLIWLLLWLNSRRLVAHKQRLERIVRERTQEIREQQQETEKQREEAEKQRDLAEERRSKIEEAHQEITQSIEYAQKIQYALLQSEEYVSPHLPEHFILFKPQSQVSGDFYWAREHKGHLYVAAVDCTGHGVPGAFMSMLGISQLNEIMGTDEVLSPGEVLTQLRDRVVRELSGSGSEETAKDGMDAALLRIPLDEQESKTIAFAGAQNPLYVIRKGIAKEDLSGPEDLTGLGVNDRLKPFKKSPDGIEIKGDPMPVGYDEYASGDFTTVSLQVQKGDMLYMFSDGYADQFGGPKGKKFRYGPFKELLVGLHEKSVEEQKAELDRVFEEWKEEGQQEQIDDVVVMGIRV